MNGQSPFGEESPDTHILHLARYWWQITSAGRKPRESVIGLKSATETYRSELVEEQG